jgi:hypothetical protein
MFDQNMVIFKDTSQLSMKRGMEINLRNFPLHAKKLWVFLLKLQVEKSEKQTK